MRWDERRRKVKDDDGRCEVRREWGQEGRYGGGLKDGGAGRTRGVEGRTEQKEEEEGKRDRKH